MGPNWNENRVALRSRRNQAGITAIGFLFVAAIFGAIALAGLKIVPLYLKRIQVLSVLEDVETELSGQGQNATSIRNEIESRFYIEGIQIPRQDVSIRQVRNGYQVHVQHETRAEFAADLWFLVVVDEQVEIPR